MNCRFFGCFPSRRSRCPRMGLVGFVRQLLSELGVESFLRFTQGTPISDVAMYVSHTAVPELGCGGSCTSVWGGLVAMCVFSWFLLARYMFVRSRIYPFYQSIFSVGGGQVWRRMAALQVADRYCTADFVFWPSVAIRNSEYFVVMCTVSLQFLRLKINLIVGSVLMICTSINL